MSPRTTALFLSLLSLSLLVAATPKNKKKSINPKLQATVSQTAGVGGFSVVQKVQTDDDLDFWGIAMCQIWLSGDEGCDWLDVLGLETEEDDVVVENVLTPDMIDVRVEADGRTLSIEIRDDNPDLACNYVTGELVLYEDANPSVGDGWTMEVYDHGYSRTGAILEVGYLGGGSTGPLVLDSVTTKIFEFSLFSPGASYPHSTLRTVESRLVCSSEPTGAYRP